MFDVTYSGYTGGPGTGMPNTDTVRASVWFLTEGSLDTEANVFLRLPYSILRVAEKES